jgi:hypothetical protein
MPLKKGKKNVGYNMRELMADNKLKGMARGANGKPRSLDQMRAIALAVALGKKGKKKYAK